MEYVYAGTRREGGRGGRRPPPALPAVGKFYATEVFFFGTPGHWNARFVSVFPFFVGKFPFLSAQSHILSSNFWFGPPLNMGPARPCAGAEAFGPACRGSPWTTSWGCTEAVDTIVLLDLKLSLHCYVPFLVKMKWRTNGFIIENITRLNHYRSEGGSDQGPDGHPCRCIRGSGAWWANDHIKCTQIRLIIVPLWLG